MALDFAILALCNHIDFAIFPNLPTDFLCLCFCRGHNNTALRLFPLDSPTAVFVRDDPDIAFLCHSRLSFLGKTFLRTNVTARYMGLPNLYAHI